MKSLIKRVLKIAGLPVYRYFNPRFHGLHERMDRLDGLVVGIHGLVAEIQRRLGEFERNISTDIETTMEVMLTHQRSTALLQERLAELKQLLAETGGSTGGSATRSPSHLQGVELVTDNPPGEGLAAER